MSFTGSYLTLVNDQNSWKSDWLYFFQTMLQLDSIGKRWSKFNACISLGACLPENSNTNQAYCMF